MNIFLLVVKKVLDLIAPQAWKIAPYIAPKRKVRDIHMIISLALVVTFWSAVPGVLLHAIAFYTAPFFDIEIPASWLNFVKLIPLTIFGISMLFIGEYAELVNKKAVERRKKRARARKGL